MDSSPTRAELESRWQAVLTATRSSTTRYSQAYRRLKGLALRIVSEPIDIDDYFPVVEDLINLLKQLDPCDCGSIFQIFHDRVSPTSIWQVRQLRMECRDLLDHLDAFEAWRCNRTYLKRVK